MTLISPEEFFGAFLAAWDRTSRDSDIPLDELFAGGGARWTRLVCGEPADGREPLVKTAIDELARRYHGLAYDWERHKVDAFGRMPRIGLDRAPSRYLDYFNVVMVEVENSVMNSDEELWKLLHYRVPLKVLITYDYNDQGRMSQMLDKFTAMQSESIDILGPDTTRYLVIVGGRKDFDKRNEIRWLAFELRHGTATEVSVNLRATR